MMNALIWAMHKGSAADVWSGSYSEGLGGLTTLSILHFLRFAMTYSIVRPIARAA